MSDGWKFVLKFWLLPGAINIGLFLLLSSLGQNVAAHNVLYAGIALMHFNMYSRLFIRHYTNSQNETK